MLPQLSKVIERAEKVAREYLDDLLSDDVLENTIRDELKRTFRKGYLEKIGITERGWGEFSVGYHSPLEEKTRDAANVAAQVFLEGFDPELTAKEKKEINRAIRAAYMYDLKKAAIEKAAERAAVDAIKFLEGELNFEVPELEELAIDFVTNRDW